MTSLIQMVSNLEKSGGKLVLDGDHVRYSVQSGSPKAQRLLAELRRRREEVVELLRHRASEGQSWPAESYDAERRFAQPHARLFPFIGRRVWTPQGAGILLSAFAERCEIQPDGTDRVVCVQSENVKPIH